MAGISFDHSKFNKMSKTGCKGGSACVGRCQKRGLSARNFGVQQRKNFQGPSPRRQLDKCIYVHKV